MGHYIFVDFLITLLSGEFTDSGRQHHADDAEQETYLDSVNGVQTTYPC
jgi:hypothetical protein